jgi:hypothetical protein
MGNAMVNYGLIRKKVELLYVFGGDLCKKLPVFVSAGIKKSGSIVGFLLVLG